MLNAEATSHAACPVASVNGSSPRAEAPSLPPRPPGPASWEGLPPGPRMPLAMQQLAFWYRRTPFFEHCRARFGSPFTIRMRFPAQPFVVISEPDQIKQMFQAPPDVLWSADGSSELMKYFGFPSLTYFEEDQHLTRRKLLNRSTHGDAMEQIGESVDKVLERELASWPLDEVVELFPRFRHLAISVVRHVNFGPEPDERLDEVVDLIAESMWSAYTPISMIEDHYLPKPALRLLTAIRPLGYRRILELRERADRLVYEVIADRRRAGGGEGRDALSVLLAGANEDGSPISDLEIRNELMTNFYAGSATTSAAMSWAIERLSRDDRVRERLVSEIDAGEDDAYLNGVVLEILRRKPPLPVIIPRLVVKPFELGGYTLKPGVRIFGSAHLVHHDPANYPDPYAFRPERWLDEKPGTYTFIPFGGGRRRCLGKGIAELELKSAIRAIFERFEIRPDSPEEELERSFFAINRPEKDTRVVVSERRREAAGTPDAGRFGKAAVA